MASSPLPSDSATPSVPIEWAAAALALAIIFDLSGTMLLKASRSFRNVAQGVGAILLYLLAVLALAYSLEGITLGVAYATWSGIGTVGAAILGKFVFGEEVSAFGYTGIALVVVGVVVMHIG